MTRRAIVSANWKSKQGLPGDRDGLVAFVDAMRGLQGVDVSVHPPFTALMPIPQRERASATVALGAQDCSIFPDGAHTGEISCEMLKGFDVRYVIVGHSERRNESGDDDDVVARKVKRVLDAGLTVILCCGEPEGVRRAGTQATMIGEQLRSALEDVVVDATRLVVAYEPIWAIGSGAAATPQDAQEMCGFIRDHLVSCGCAREQAQRVRLQYGGSVTAENAASFASCPDVDGVLVGGASLATETFLPLVNAFQPEGSI
jgi:triosephosphate isomerase (TIM)